MNKHILKTFIEGKKTSDEVKAFLRHSFEKKRERDVQLLAAQALALQFLEEAWLELERYKRQTADTSTDGNIGL